MDKYQSFLPFHKKGVAMPIPQSQTDPTETELILKGYGLTTAEVFYGLPDHPDILTTFVWQNYDLDPKYPNLVAFLNFWKTKIEGPLHSVRFTHQKLIRPGEWRNVTGEFRLH